MSYYLAYDYTDELGNPIYGVEPFSTLAEAMARVYGLKREDSEGKVVFNIILGNEVSRGTY